MKPRSTEGKQTWCTPRPLFAALQRVYGFEVDLAATAANALCDAFITPEMDALGKPWSTWTFKAQSRGFCNPPYRTILPWVERFEVERRRGWLIGALLPAGSTETEWYRTLYYNASEIWHLYPRVPFIDETGSPVRNNPGGSILAIYRPDKIGDHPAAIGFLDLRQLLERNTE